MRAPRVRFSVTRLMVAVAIAGASLGLARRAAHFRSLAADHTMPIPWVGRYHSGHEGDEGRYYDGTGRYLAEREVALFLWHARLRKKYADASLRPWLSASPDPPMP